MGISNSVPCMCVTNETTQQPHMCLTGKGPLLHPSGDWRRQLILQLSLTIQDAVHPIQKILAGK